MCLNITYNQNVAIEQKQRPRGAFGSHSAGYILPSGSSNLKVYLEKKKKANLQDFYYDLKYATNLITYLRSSIVKYCDTVLFP